MHEKRWRKARLIIMKGSLAVLLGLEILWFFVKDRRETPLQSVAFIFEIAVVCGLQLMIKKREKFEQPKMWLDHREFMLDEKDRMNKSIRFARWTSLLLSIAVACVGLYAIPFLSGGWKIACLAATAVVIIVFQVYDFRRISQFKRSRNELIKQLDYLQRE
jgi:membrane protein YdbS with pleckstrin-like domain